MARAVVTRRSKVVGLILFNETNRHHPGVISAETSAVIDYILSYQLDGVIAAAPIPHDDLAHLTVPQVLLLFYNRPAN